jgi:hypothetical protein
MTLAVFMFFMSLWGGDFSERELVISRKYTSGVGSNIQFRLDNELPYPQRGFEFDTTVSRGFYNAAKTGDLIRSPLTGYLKLVRDGRTVTRYFSQDFVVPALFSFVALLPIVVFLKLGPSPYRRVLLILVCFVEALIIGASLYGLFVPCC